MEQKIEKLEAKKAELERKQKELNAKIRSIRSKELSKQRKEQTHYKILLGSYYLHQIANNVIPLTDKITAEIKSFVGDEIKAEKVISYMKEEIEKKAKN